MPFVKVDQLPPLFHDVFQSASVVDATSAVLDVASPTPLLPGGSLSCLPVRLPNGVRLLLDKTSYCICGRGGGAENQHFGNKEKEEGKAPIKIILGEGRVTSTLDAPGSFFSTMDKKAS